MSKPFLALGAALALALTGCNEAAQKGAASEPTSTATTSQSTTGGSTTTTTTSGAAVTTEPAPAATQGGKVHKLATGLQYEDLVVGAGKMAEPGMNVSVKYTGWLTDGTQFDTGTYKLQLGAGEVIQGWDQGLKGMRIGGKRKLTVPPDLGYGARGAGGVIPPNATLVFEVELVDVQ